MHRILDALSTPAYIRNSRFDILAANQLGFALYAEILTQEALPLNLARFMFLDQRASDFYTEWEAVADDMVAALRTEAGKNPLDRKLTDLVGELATRSEPFRTRWARHNVRLHRTARKRIQNPVIGEIALIGDALVLPGEDLTLITYTAEADSQAQEQLSFLASWSANQTRAKLRAQTLESSTEP